MPNSLSVNRTSRKLCLKLPYALCAPAADSIKR